MRADHQDRRAGQGFSKTSPIASGRPAPDRCRIRCGVPFRDAQFGHGWCTKSPVISASSPSETTRRLTCPGVWPTSRNQAEFVADADDRSPPVAPGRHPGSAARNRPGWGCMSGRAVLSRQCSYSGSAHQVSAPAGNARHPCLPSCNIVFQPTWSTCRWVHSTALSIATQAGKPASSQRDRRGNGPCLWSFQCGIRRFCLSLPRQVSTMMRLPGVSTMKL